MGDAHLGNRRQRKIKRESGPIDCFKRICCSSKKVFGVLINSSSLICGRFMRGLR